MSTAAAEARALDRGVPPSRYASGWHCLGLASTFRDGKLGRLLKNCSYQSVTPQFWAGLDALGGPDEWKVHGVPSCNKGEPLQVAHVGHGTVPGRFQNVQVGR